MPAMEPTTRFVLFGPGRSGSTLLVSLLDSHPDIYCEDEILHDPVLFPLRYVRCRARLSSKDVYGFKLLSYQLQTVQKRITPVLLLRELDRADFKIVYLSRRNALRHALSNLYARRTQVFHHRITDGELVRPRVHIDLQELITWMEGLERTRNFEIEALRGFDYLPLVYEDDLENSACHQQAVDRLTQYLGISSASVATEMVKITGKHLADTVENYEELVEFISRTRYAEFLAR